MNKQNKKNSRAWIRIIEAFLASLILLGAVLTLISNQDTKADISGTVGERQEKILEIIRTNEVFRGYVLDGDINEINLAIKQMIPPAWNFTTNICDIQVNCPSLISDIYNKDTDIYVRETSIFTNSAEYKPKKLVFFVWTE